MLYRVVYAGLLFTAIRTSNREGSPIYPTAPSPPAAVYAVGTLVASLGTHNLYLINDDYYLLCGPDARYSRAWLQEMLPAGDWLTRWSGHDEDLFVHITR